MDYNPLNKMRTDDSILIRKKGRKEIYVKEMMAFGGSGI
jgi:hypothetical protein